jgi:hypothetical protein
MTNHLKTLPIKSALLVTFSVAMLLVSVNYGHAELASAASSPCVQTTPATNPTDYCLNEQVDVSSLPNSDTPSGQDEGSVFIKTALNILFGVLGAICFLIITIAGLRYVVSRGEPEAISRSKDTIIYALVGLVICIVAISIVNFVIGNI